MFLSFLNYGMKVDPAPQILWRLDMIHPEGLTGSSESKIRSQQTLLSFTHTRLGKHNSFYHNSSKGHACGRRSREPVLPSCSYPALPPCTGPAAITIVEPINSGSGPAHVKGGACVLSCRHRSSCGVGRWRIFSEQTLKALLKCPLWNLQV